MKITSKAKALITLSLISTSVFAEKCYETITPVVGQTVYTSTGTTEGTIYAETEIVKLRSNKNYVLRSIKELSNGNKYLTNMHKNYLFVTRGCGYTTSNKSFNIEISEQVYILEQEVITPGDYYAPAIVKNIASQVEIIAFNPNHTQSLYQKSELDEIDSETEETSNHPILIGNTAVYSKRYCSDNSDDGQEICPGDFAISLGYGVDVEVLGISFNNFALVQLRDGTIQNVQVKQLLKTQESEDFSSTIEP
jgi:hypothetical protein